ncbi:uncharacterized protein LOC135467058 [Liolophura sinensis]|uniref:uncharacterized protein LOC135467058 n=1 Tax=Liolophura sinensis TaxID=3198878 RepID=UPI0031587C98
MGKLLSKLQDVFGQIEMVPSKLLMVGLESAGKSTILYKIKLDEDDVQTLPTVGFNVETVTVCKNVTFTVWDVGGQEKLRRLWDMFFKGSHGILFVVDSSDRERMASARKELTGMCGEEELRGIPLIVIANKQDITDAMSTSEVADFLNLGTIKDRYWSVRGTCAARGDGLLEAMATMAACVKNHQKNNSKWKKSKYI